MSPIKKVIAMPKCPACGTASKVTMIGTTAETFHCGRCSGLFDLSEDGGDYDDRDPSRRMEREEARLNRAGYRGSNPNRRNQ